MPDRRPPPYRPCNGPGAAESVGSGAGHLAPSDEERGGIMTANRERDTMTATDRREKGRPMSETINTPTEPYHCEHTEHATRGDGRYGRHFETADLAGAWEPCPSPPDDED